MRAREHRARLSDRQRIDVDRKTQDARAAGRARVVQRVQRRQPVRQERLQRRARVRLEQHLHALESSSRAGLQRLLSQWVPQLNALRFAHKGVLRWAIDVDPLAI